MRREDSFEACWNDAFSVIESCFVEIIRDLLLANDVSERIWIQWWNPLITLSNNSQNFNSKERWICWYFQKFWKKYLYFPNYLFQIFLFTTHCQRVNKQYYTSIKNKKKKKKNKKKHQVIKWEVIPTHKEEIKIDHHSFLIPIGIAACTLKHKKNTRLHLRRFTRREWCRIFIKAAKNVAHHRKKILQMLDKMRPPHRWLFVRVSLCEQIIPYRMLVGMLIWNRREEIV